MPNLTLRDGIDIYYEEFGSGPPIVFTSAGLMTHKQWDHQVSFWQRTSELSRMTGAEPVAPASQT